MSMKAINGSVCRKYNPRLNAEILTKNAVIANAEDGYTYRWDLAKDTLTRVNLNPPIGEAYTPTVVGPDGSVYAINNATLYSLGK